MKTLVKRYVIEGDTSNRQTLVKIYKQSCDKKNVYITESYDVHMKKSEAQTLEQAIEQANQRAFLEHKKCLI
jgi:hypothetical protein